VLTSDQTEVVLVSERNNAGLMELSQVVSEQTSDSSACLNVTCLLKYVLNCERSLDSSVGRANGYGLDDLGVEFESRKGKKFSLLHVVQTGSGVHPTSYPMGNGELFSGGKAAGT
jgi:hypothetical protein